MYYFSATMLSFYPSESLEIYADTGTLPGDLLEVDDDIYAQFSAQPPAGKMLGTSKKGMPAWVSIPPLYCFSPTTLDFYPRELLDIYRSAGTLPNDVIEIEDDIYTQFSAQPPAGKVRGADKKGKPVWLDVPTPIITVDDIAATARRYRDAFIAATDALTIIDYSIDDSPLTDEQRGELMAVRLAFKAWPTVAGWPLVELPELPQWLLIEAVNNGYRVPVWPDAAYVA